MNTGVTFVSTRYAAHPTLGLVALLSSEVEYVSQLGARPHATAES